MSYILIIGAKSDIAKEIARIYAKNGYSLYLAGRNINECDSFAKDIKVRSNAKDIKVELKEFDVLDYKTHESFFDALSPKPLGVIVAAGYMGEQKDCEQNWEETLKTINTNYTGALSILNIVANHMEAQKNGFIVGISSVAGERGRRANYIYGSSKAAFSAYLSGLRNRLYEANVNVLSVKPGFVYTKMTKHLDLPPKLSASPKQVAYEIFRAQQKRKDVIYVKRIWKFIMLVIKNIPEMIFKRMSI